MAGSPDVHTVGFIGSVATGQRVAERAAGKEVLLEMGGNGPMVILEDADLEGAVAATMVACFLNAGQSCTAGERIPVHRSVHDEYLSRLIERVDREVRLGDPFDESTTMGPLNNEPTAAKTERHVGEAVNRGAALLVGGRRVDRRKTPLFFEATILDGVGDQMEIAREETFGPVVPVSTIDSDEAALEIANASPYGLLTSVFTRDLGRGLNFAEKVERVG